MAGIGKNNTELGHPLPTSWWRSRGGDLGASTPFLRAGEPGYHLSFC
jgi:hypothetical protein